ncbi:MAG: ornithine cyclodeaminase family protein [Polyangiaceae bacterium]|nr:ornithine cyclodeaminase family protein [Polyangiaceae bacterium]
MKTRILSRADLEKLLSMPDAVRAVEGAFLAHGRGEALMPPKVYLSLPQHGGDFRAMPSYLDGAAGVKWVNSHPDNPKKHGLPAVMALYVLSDPETARPLAILDGTLLTAARTGAAAAVASRHLARRGARTIGLVGTGVQSRFLLSAHRVLFPDLEVLAHDLDPASAARFAGEVGGRVAPLDEVAGCDIVCTSTPGREIVVRSAMVRDGAHVNAMGADAPGKQELESALVARARIVIDDHEQATHSGEINVPLHDGALREAQIFGTLGEVVAGKRPGRVRDDEITLFDSTGLAIQDLALARVLFERARAAGAGVELDLVGIAS